MRAIHDHSTVCKSVEEAIERTHSSGAQSVVGTGVGSEEMVGKSDMVGNGDGAAVGLGEGSAIATEIASRAKSPV